MTTCESTKVTGLDRLALAMRYMCVDRFKYLYNTMGDEKYNYIFYEGYKFNVLN